MVLVVNVDRTPLMPCSPVVARLLLDGGHAKVVRITPFTIRLTRAPETVFVNDLALGVDSGSRTPGFGVVDGDGNVYYASEVELPQDIGKKMEQRRMYRRNRRARKSRYRNPRFLNRKNSIKDGRLPPTLRSKIDAHAREINFIQKVLPIRSIVIEAGTFDPHALKNPAVQDDPAIYQRGELYGFANVKAFVLDRDGYTCRHCNGRSRETRLHVHHITWRSRGGSDDPENLLTLCKACHDGVHDGSVTLNARGKRKGPLRHAMHQIVINKRLLERIPGATATFGYITKTNREALGLPKTHYNDALVISSRGNPLKNGDIDVLSKRCVPKGDYQRTKGVRSEKRIPDGKVHGFRKFDKVCYRGKTCFVKGRRSTGYFALMDIDGTALPFKPIPKAKSIQRLEARTSWMVTTITT